MRERRLRSVQLLVAVAAAIALEAGPAPVAGQTPLTPAASPISRHTGRQVSLPFEKLEGLGTMIDYGLAPYYRDRSPRGIAKEIRHAGFSWVIGYAHSLTPELAQALRAEGLAVVLQLWGTIIYSPASCRPAPPDSALQVFASGPQRSDANPKFYCPNRPELIAWHKTYARPLLERFRPRFYAESSPGRTDLALVIEAFLGDLPGPESPTYGCVCAACRELFAQEYPAFREIPDFGNAESPFYWRQDRPRYQAWVTFRARSMARFLGQVYEGIAEIAPQVGLAGSMLALGQRDGLAQVRECNGHDAALLARAVEWDCFYLQAHWPDWLRADLRPTEHVRSYEPFLRELRRQVPDLRVGILTDSGSDEAMRRSLDWLREAHAAARDRGYHGLGIYEYSISRFIYEDPPRLVETTLQDAAASVELVFSKRLDPLSATTPGHYTLESGEHPRTVEFDGGNIVTLRFADLPRNRAVNLHITGVRDDPSRFWFHAPRAGRPRYPGHVIGPGTRVELRRP